MPSTLEMSNECSLAEKFFNFKIFHLSTLLYFSSLIHINFIVLCVLRYDENSGVIFKEEVVTVATMNMNEPFFFLFF